MLWSFLRNLNGARIVCLHLDFCCLWCWFCKCGMMCLKVFFICHFYLFLLFSPRRYGFSKQTKQDQVGVFMVNFTLESQLSDSISFYCYFTSHCFHSPPLNHSSSTTLFWVEVKFLVCAFLFFDLHTPFPSSRWMGGRLRWSLALRRLHLGWRRCRRKTPCRQLKRWVILNYVTASHAKHEKGMPEHFISKLFRFIMCVEVCLCVFGPSLAFRSASW